MVKIENLCFEIGSFAFKDLSLTINSHEYFVMTGPNGAGKTLIIKLICGIYRPSSGTICIDGEEVQDTPSWERNIGYVPQDPSLFPNRNVERNIAFGLEIRKIPKAERREKVERIAALVNISDLLGRDIAGLSGGERQKISLARALVLEPKLLLLDEPVSAIDEDFRNKLCTELRNIQQKLSITTLHISHNREEMNMVADRIAYLHDGRINFQK